MIMRGFLRSAKRKDMPVGMWDISLSKEVAVIDSASLSLSKLICNLTIQPDVFSDHKGWHAENCTQKVRG